MSSRSCCAACRRKAIDPCLPAETNALLFSENMDIAFKILSDFAEIERRKVADRVRFLALPPDEAQRQVDLGLLAPLCESDPGGVGLGRGLTDEEDGLVDE